MSSMAVQTGTQQTYSALAVANYILTHCQGITNLKLQKMLYFVQGFALAEWGEPLFTDEIQAWTYGPVVPSVYEQYMDFGSRPITRLAPSELLDAPRIRAFLDPILESMVKYTSVQLVAMTHRAGTPWSITWDGGLGRFKRIPFELIREYFQRKLKPSRVYGR